MNDQPSNEDLTAWIRKASDGDQAAWQALYPWLRASLYDPAHRQLQGSAARPIVDTMGVIHEASMAALAALKAAGKLTPENETFCREDFFRLAARIIRHNVLDAIDSEKARKEREKKVGECRPASTEPDAQASDAYKSIVRALDALEQHDLQIATIFTLYHFGNQSAKPLTMEQIAENLGISKTAVFNRIKKGKEWIGEWLSVNAPDVL